MSSLNLNVNDAIERLMDFYGVASNFELADKLKMQPSSISSWKTKNSISAVKKKCRELGIYKDIFGDINTTFTQHGDQSQQIQTQNNSGDSINNINNPNTLNIDDDILKLIEALNSVASALNKKEELKEELTNLISKLPTL
jgi:hypothetical protein